MSMIYRTMSVTALAAMLSESGRGYVGPDSPRPIGPRSTLSLKAQKHRKRRRKMARVSRTINRKRP